jgi:phage recombination protein Bet
MNAITTTERGALSLTEEELLDVMEASLFPGAARTSIKMVLGYCIARDLDPMLKPAHIVPMSCKKAGTDKYEWRDVVMPAIGLYRIQAARTGQHAGTDEPVYGPMMDLKVGDFVIQHPEWCRVTVYRLIGGQRCAFTATEYWTENYATAGRDSMLPNAMWKKRVRAQLSKCAEAQALRKGFPEVGNQPTSDEMEGKGFDFELEPNGTVTPSSLTPQRKSDQATAAPASATTSGGLAQTAEEGATPPTTPSATPAPRPSAPPPAPSTINPGQVKYLQQKIAALDLNQEAVGALLSKLQIKAIDTTMTAEQFDALKSDLLAAS